MRVDRGGEAHGGGSGSGSGGGSGGDSSGGSVVRYIVVVGK